MDWIDLDWIDLVWAGVELDDWFGVGMDWHGLARSGLVWFGVDWNGVDWAGIGRLVWSWHGLVWNGVAWHGLDWCGLAWFGRIINHLYFILSTGGFQNFSINGLLICEVGIVGLHLDEHEVDDLAVVDLQEKKIWSTAPYYFPTLAFVLLKDFQLVFVDHYSPFEILTLYIHRGHDA